jgi:hypothetical protein
MQGETDMAKQEILDLDALVSQLEQKFVTWHGKPYPIIGVTGESYLGFLSNRSKMAQAQESQDEQAQFNLTVDMICLLVPDMAQERAELMALNMTILNKLMAVVMATFTGSDELTKDVSDSGTPVGESTGPQ